MIRTPYWYWLVPDERTGKLRKTKHLMTEATALSRHPGAVKVGEPAEWRDLPEPSDDSNHNRPAAH